MAPKQWSVKPPGPGAVMAPKQAQPAPQFVPAVEHIPITGREVEKVKAKTKKLQVTITKATGLKHLNWAGDAPWCKCVVHGVNHGESCSTKALTGLNPEWNEMHELSWQKGDFLIFTLYDKGMVGSKIEGEVTVRSEDFDDHGFQGDLPISGLEHATLTLRIVPPDCEDRVAAMQESPAFFHNPFTKDSSKPDEAAAKAADHLVAAEHIALVNLQTAIKAAEARTIEAEKKATIAAEALNEAEKRRQQAVAAAQSVAQAAEQRAKTAEAAAAAAESKIQELRAAAQAAAAAAESKIQASQSAQLVAEQRARTAEAAAAPAGSKIQELQAAAQAAEQRAKTAEASEIRTAAAAESKIQESQAAAQAASAAATRAIQKTTEGFKSPREPEAAQLRKEVTQLKQQLVVRGAKAETAAELEEQNEKLRKVLGVTQKELAEYKSSNTPRSNTPRSVPRSASNLTLGDQFSRLFH